jgi:hypothetical protein
MRQNPGLSRMLLQKLLQHEQVVAHHSKLEPGNITNTFTVPVTIAKKYNLKSNVGPKLYFQKGFITKISIKKLLKGNPCKKNLSGQRRQLVHVRITSEPVKQAGESLTYSAVLIELFEMERNDLSARVTRSS